MSEEEDGRDCGDGWFAYLTDEGEEYYYNEALDQTVWELPGQVGKDDEQEQSEDLIQGEGDEDKPLQRSSSRSISRQASQSDVDPDSVVRPSDTSRDRRLTVDEVNR